MREYVRERGLESCLNDIEAVYDRAEDIDWDALPHSFAMKWNFGCSYNIICRSKDQLDKKAAKRQMEKWGREPFWAYYSELQYRGVDKKIIVEEYIGSPEGLPPEDYKFYCFHGHAHCVMVCAGREEGWPRFYFFDRKFQLMRINHDGKEAPDDFSLPKPQRVEEAFEIADRLSWGFPFVRVDLYLTERGVRFGEMTFTPSAALIINASETDLLWKYGVGGAAMSRWNTGKKTLSGKKPAPAKRRFYGGLPYGCLKMRIPPSGFAGELFCAPFL